MLLAVEVASVERLVAIELTKRLSGGRSKISNLNVKIERFQPL